MPKTNLNRSLDALCDVPGLRVGHAQHDVARTGCTVVLPEAPAIAGVDVRGSAPGTRELELLRPVRLVTHIHGLLLTGGSAFGLDAAGGVQQYLEEQAIGFDAGGIKVPIVPAAVIFDLSAGNVRHRPDRAMGYRAAKAAVAGDSASGAVGAGRGARVGKIAGPAHTMPGGLGQASEALGGGLVVGALAVVNALGDVVDGAGRIVAGARDASGRFLDSLQVLRSMTGQAPPAWGENTTLAVVATNAALNREQATKVAQMAQDGLARAIRPVHTMYDGDIVFALSTGTHTADITLIGAIAAEVVARAIVKAVTGEQT